VSGANWAVDVLATLDEVELVVVELLAMTAEDVPGEPGETVISAVTVVHGASLDALWADGTSSFETTKVLAAAGSATALE